MKTKLITLSTILLFSLQTLTAQEQKSPKWKFGVSGSIGHRTSDTEDGMKILESLDLQSSSIESFYNQLKWVPGFDIETYYLIKPKWGVGLKYSFAKNSRSSEWYEEETHSVYPESYRGVEWGADEKKCFHFIAPTAYAQIWLNAKQNLQLTAELSLGYVRYYGQSAFRKQMEPYSHELNTLINHDPANDPFHMEGYYKGNTFGKAFGVGLEYFFHKRWAVGVDFSYFFAYVKNKKEFAYYGKYIKFDWPKTYSLNRLDLSAGIRFYM